MHGSSSLLDRLSEWLRLLLLFGAPVFILIYLAVAAARIAYPFELEGLEGSSLMQVRRILSGHLLYGPPTMEHTPFLYTPLYFYLSAAVAVVMQGGFMPLRLVSIAASIGSLILIYRLVSRETKSKACALLSASLFAATFRLGGAWFDIARVDSLVLFMLLLGVYAIRRSGSGKAACTAGILMGLAVLTKQSALLVGVTLGFQGVLPERRRWSLLFMTTFLGLTGASTLLFDAISSGWYSFYTFRQTRAHELVPSQILEFWTVDLARPLGIAMALTILYLCYLAAMRLWEPLVFSGLFLAGMLGMAWGSRIHWGGYDNVLMPAHAVLAIYFGLGLDVLLNRLPRRSVDLWTQSPVYALCLIQFASLLYNPMNQVPSTADRAAGEELVRRLRSIDGEVLVLHHAYLASLAGKKSSAEPMALDEAIMALDHEQATRLQSEIRSTVLSGKLTAIVLDNERWQFMDEVRKRYSCSGPIFSDETVFWTRTGVKTRPQEICTLRDSPVH